MVIKLKSTFCAESNISTKFHPAVAKIFQSGPKWPILPSFVTILMFTFFFFYFLLSLLILGFCLHPEWPSLWKKNPLRSTAWEDAFVSLDTDLLFSLLVPCHCRGTCKLKSPIKVTMCQPCKLFVISVLPENALNVKFATRLKPVHFFSLIGAVKS